MVHRAGFVGRMGPPQGGDSSIVILDLTARSVPSYTTFTRASNATDFNNAGTLITATTNEPRFDFNPLTLQPRGLLLEGARTNGIRNSQASGSSAGSPGTLPTNWTGFTGGGLTRTVVGSGVANGFSYVDVRFNGTTSSASGCSIEFDGTTAIAGLNGQTWARSVYLSIVGGSTANLTFVRQNQRMLDSGGATLGTLFGFDIASTLSSTITRVSEVGTNNQAATAFVQSLIEIAFGSGVAVDITLRIAAPQLELGAFASSYIPTTGAAATRAADSAVITNLASIRFNPLEGTILAEFEYMGLQPSGFIQYVYYVSDGTANNFIAHRYNAGAAINEGIVRTSGVTQASLSRGSVGVNTVYRAALAFQQDNYAMSLNGDAVTTDIAGTIPSGLTTLQLGGDGGGTTLLFGWLRRLTYYPTRLPDVQLPVVSTV